MPKSHLSFARGFKPWRLTSTQAVMTPVLSFNHQIPVQITAVSSWRDCGTDSQTISPRGTSHPRDRNSPRAISPMVSRDDGKRGRGGAAVMTAGQRDHGPRDCGVATTAADHSGRGDQGGRARRGGSLTYPSSNTEDDGGGGGRASLPGVLPGGRGKDVDNTALFAQQYQQQREGGDTAPSVVVRSPSPTTGLATAALRRVEKAGGKPGAVRLWGRGDAGESKRGGGAPGVPQPRRNGNRARKGTKATGFKCGRRTELTDWIETNTNLVNVSPW